MVSLNFIPPEDIEKKTIAFLSQYHRNGSIPIPIEEIIEIKLKNKDQSLLGFAVAIWN